MAIFLNTGIILQYYFFVIIQILLRQKEKSTNFVIIPNSCYILQNLASLLCPCLSFFYALFLHDYFKKLDITDGFLKFTYRRRLCRVLFLEGSSR